MAVHGRIAEVGEVDYYSIDVPQGGALRFEALSSDPLDPAIAIYELTGSWFSPDRATRLAFLDDPVSYPGLTTEAVAGLPLRESGQLPGTRERLSGATAARTIPTSFASCPRPRTPSNLRAGRGQDSTEWLERTWTRKLDTDRMKLHCGRVRYKSRLPDHHNEVAQDETAQNDASTDDDAAAIRTKSPSSTPMPSRPRFPSSRPSSRVPALVVGTIERPGDIDRVRFAAKEGDKLILEIETPAKSTASDEPLPARYVDADGVEAFTNVYSNVNANGNISKQNQSKTAFAFARDGEFTLEIRDITASYGDSEMRYRVLVRPQVPHMGEVHIEQDRLNLVAGRAKKLSIITDQEEAFDGFVVLSIEGLPNGVRSVHGNRGRARQSPRRSTRARGSASRPRTRRRPSSSSPARHAGDAHARLRDHLRAAGRRRPVGRAHPREGAAGHGRPPTGSPQREPTAQDRRRPLATEGLFAVARTSGLQRRPPGRCPPQARDG